MNEVDRPCDQADEADEVVLLIATEIIPQTQTRIEVPVKNGGTGNGRGN